MTPVSALVLSLFAGGGAWADTVAAAATPESAVVAQVEFDDSFLQQPGSARIDFSRFNKGNVVLPGVYRVDLYVNQVFSGNADINFRPIGGDESDVQACLDSNLIERAGVDMSKLRPEAAALVGSDKCVPLSRWVEDAIASFDSGKLRLDVSIPQIAMTRSARGYVDPKYWDEGINAASLQYNTNSYHSGSNGQSFSQNYVGLNGGVNVGPWRLRHMGSLNNSSQGGTRYQSVQTNLQRSIVPLKSQLVVGDGFTDGAVFDSVGFRGAQLASDDRMYPESQRGYAPVVRGVANSNARVQIRQNGNVIYETTVAPGAFEINDLYPTGYGSDLEVVVTEADGRVFISKVPFAAAVNALRPGVTRYSTVIGQYRSPSIDATPMMYQATVQHGFNNLLTGYGGVALADGYASAALGAALNTDWGAFGADITHATTQLRDQPNRDGQSIRLAYSKLLEPTNTNVSVAAYRYSSRNFLSLSDAVNLRDLEERHLGFAEPDTQRGRLQLTFNQTLPNGYGSLYLSGSKQNYWNRDGSDTQYQVGYSGFYKSINFGISAVRQYNTYSRQWDNSVMLTLGIPLGTDSNRAYSTTNVQRNQHGGTSVQQAISGTVGEDGKLSYGLNASNYSSGSNDSRGGNTSYGGNVTYAAPVATLNASASNSGAYTQVGAGISGSIVAYSGGVVLAPRGGDTMTIVEAKDAKGARVGGGGNGLQIDSRGRAVVASMVPFAQNTVTLDPKGLPLNVELKSTQKGVAPTAGAITVVQFETADIGRAAIIRARKADGAPIPFGAEVFNAAGDNVGTVAQGGRVIVRGLKSDSGSLSVRWSDETAATCAIDYALPAVGASSAVYTEADALCR